LHAETQMMVVTHEISFARHVGDRTVFMDEGRIVEEGSPDDIIEAPKNERTRKFFSPILRHSRRQPAKRGLSGRRAPPSTTMVSPVM
jgi:ABC-type glutathione transport system ATPase component